jgi:hypothetical protein
MLMSAEVPLVCAGHPSAANPSTSARNGSLRCGHVESGRSGLLIDRPEECTCDFIWTGQYFVKLSRVLPAAEIQALTLRR